MENTPERTGTADPYELRQMAEAWPEDIFPTPPPERQAKDAAAAHVLRRMAVPHLLACAERIEELEGAIREHRDVYRATSEQAARPLGVDPEAIITPVERRLWQALGDGR